MRRDLRTAVAANQLRLVYQPLGDVHSQSIRSCEALIRWDHPDLGTIPPDEFIPLAESANLMRDFTRWAIETAVRECTRWPDHIGVSVNLSARDLKSRELVDYVFEVLVRYGLQPGRLTLELTETAITDEPEMTRQILKGLRSLGVQVSLDDFGTGYANFGYLIEYDFNQLKLDRSLIVQVYTDKRASKLIEGLSRTAKDLGLCVVAEGVETVEQFQALRALGSIDRVQGWLLSKPLASGTDIRWRLEDPGFVVAEPRESDTDRAAATDADQSRSHSKKVG